MTSASSCRCPPRCPPALAALVGLALALRLGTGAARACCEERPATEHLDRAEQVFLGRAGKKVVQGKSTVQRFTVLHPIKGTLGPFFDRVLPLASSGRDELSTHREFAAGELAIVFVRGGDIDFCSGNFPLATQLRDLPRLLSGGRSTRRLGPLEVEAMHAALSAALRDRLHGRPRLTVAYPPLAGRTIDVQRTRVAFERTAPAGVAITRSTVAGAVRLVSGTHGREGLEFDVLLLRRVERSTVAFEVLQVWRRRRKG